MLWLALNFPLLPLEALPLRQSPSAVVQRGRLLACDAVASAAGVVPGQKLSTALGLAPGLRAFEREAARETLALDQLACWAGNFTPTVSLALPDVLLLEIGGCLRLFGGLNPIVEAALAGCTAQGWTTQWAVAPTPLAARWLARAGAAAVCAAPEALPAALAALPCAVTGWPVEALSRLEAFGVRRLGDLATLPLAGLRQRIGNVAVDEWLRAQGQLPDPQRAFVFPECFVQSLELPSRVEHAEALIFAGQRLFAALCGWLHGRQLLLRSCSLHLDYDGEPPGILRLALGEPSADGARLLRLLREHLGRLQLAGPVERLRLEADEVMARPGDSIHLFDVAPSGEGTAACLERLQARLGEGAVRRLGVREEHRPECATVEASALAGAVLASGMPPASDSVFAQNEQCTAAASPQRPLWLLPEPQALAERGGGPHWHGRLELLTRGERLESGWWDGGEAEAVGDVRRDYFVARNPLGQWAWIFRDARGWFLHGLFA